LSRGGRYAICPPVALNCVVPSRADDVSCLPGMAPPSVEFTQLQDGLSR
jgi:hypothetical protein